MSLVGVWCAAGSRSTVVDSGLQLEAHVPSEAARAAVAKPSHIALVGVAAITVVGMLVAPPRARAAVEVHLVAAGDFGGSNRASDVIAAASAETPDALLELGDLSYSTGPEEDWCAWVKGITARAGDAVLVCGAWID